jgi:hypothetical protein
VPKKIAVPEGKAVLWGVLMDMEDALIRLNTLPDSATLTNSEAALFLRLSTTTFDRMRVAGTGPIYMQGGSYGAKGTNQACTYHIKDLRDWQAGNKVSNPLEAAIRKGQTFSTIFELGQQEAFYVDPFGRIEGMCERTQVATVVERIGQWDIAWMTPVEAASREWSSMSAHQPFAAEVQSVLSTAASGVAQGVAATELGDGITPGASNPNRKPPL